MAEAEPQEENCENSIETMEKCNNDLEKLLEEMEKITVRAAWMTYGIVTIHTNPDLASSMKHLEDAFLRCKEQVGRKWQEVLKESKGEEE
ncbi:synaptonemal complex central element protein 3 [Corapipo altera]|uniref:synaptonemal complex central element protein 3 n=1 Tax=Corapipo altera TaxID=415028 RepID=UPI000FD66761|nr:synaptonemal complex central element protein 3 [Corapipo altera]XP_027516547.1 synaptonemal complex central element protein 3 [Corapipo altera]XP_027516548.1 synaptonemal complex central element protein 3 [Corapipo altera]XP_027516549.1 synaptonemal complex central element protein 3 [Corapipo altera]XP_027516550.1 synaptonemal complex central element protein 3 [Corapipo altera]XP_027516551.1 synaptonemal complex central element protein 3 [Corapipo altera]XP_027516552.1 synaptonemal complex